MKRHLWPNCASCLLKFFLLYFLGSFSAQAAEMPAVRLTQAILNEKSLAFWIGVEQGFFRKHGVSVEIIQTRTSTQTIAALASGEIQIAGTTPSVVLNAALAGMDVAFFCGIVNRADGDFMVAPGIRRAEDLRGKKLGVQSIGGGVWSLAMLALDHLGLEPTRDKIFVMVVGDQSVLTQAMAAGRIDASYLGIPSVRSLRKKDFLRSWISAERRSLTRAWRLWRAAPTLNRTLEQSMRFLEACLSRSPLSRTPRIGT